jgi:hypothetical protein
VALSRDIHVRYDTIKPVKVGFRARL